MVIERKAVLVECVSETQRLVAMFIQINCTVINNDSLSARFKFVYIFNKFICLFHTVGVLDDIMFLNGTRMKYFKTALRFVHFFFLCKLSSFIV